MEDAKCWPRKSTHIWANYRQQKVKKQKAENAEIAKSDSPAMLSSESSKKQGRKRKQEVEEAGETGKSKASEKVEMKKQRGTRIKKEDSTDDGQEVENWDVMEASVAWRRTTPMQMIPTGAR